MFPNLCSFREACTQVAKKNFAEQWKKGRVEFIPLDWRTSLTLDEGLCVFVCVFVCVCVCVCVHVHACMHACVCCVCVCVCVCVCMH